MIALPPFTSTLVKVSTPTLPLQPLVKISLRLALRKLPFLVASGKGKAVAERGALLLLFLHGSPARCPALSLIL